MTFEKALEAMRKGKKVKIVGDEYPYFIEDGVLYHYDGKGGFEKQKLGFDSFMLFSHVSWEICDPVYGQMTYNEWKGLKNKLEPHEEESTMYTDLEITFKSGETLTYKEGEWDDYSYDGKSVAVKKSGVWVGLYNFDNVFCVELKKREG